MDKKLDTVNINETTKGVPVEIPDRLAVRIKKYAEENGMSFTNTVIEALDQFLRIKK